MNRSIFHAILLFFITFSCIYSSDQKLLRNIAFKFLPYSTEEYLYTKTITTTINSLQNNCSTEPTIISDTTNRSYFTTGITRELITQQFFNNQNVITTETWITKKSSYCTLTNMSLMTALTIITGATLLLHHDDFVLSTSDHWLTYLLTHEKYKTKIIVSLSDKIINQKLICEQDILKAVGEMGLQQFKKMLK